MPEEYDPTDTSLWRRKPDARILEVISLYKSGECSEDFFEQELTEFKIRATQKKEN